MNCQGGDFSEFIQGYFLQNIIKFLNRRTLLQ